MSGYLTTPLPSAGGKQYGLRSLMELLGVDALDPPNNTLYRMGDGYNATLAELLLFKNGMLQDTSAPPDYQEADSRTVQMVLPLIPADRLMGVDIVRDSGTGGLLAVDRPPLNVGGAVYQTSQNFASTQELYVFLNGQLLLDTVGYNITAINQFTLTAPLPPGGVLVAVVIKSGLQGIAFRETYIAFGAFPAVILTANPLNKNETDFLVFINGQLQSEDFDYMVFYNRIAVIRVVPGVNDIEIVGINASHPSKWRA
jgi:hypothetical protein